MKKNYRKVLLGILALVLIIFGLYLYDFHALALEGNKIFEQRCLTVNPPLIAYKNSFLSFADSMKFPNKYTKKEVAGFYDGYISGMREYGPKENEWIEKQNSFINRPDFKLIEPWYVKEGGQYQVLMYEGNRDEALAAIDAVDGRITLEEFSKRFDEARTKRNKYMDLYNSAFDKAVKIRDWRKYFGRVPVPVGCNEGNLNIPDTTGALDPTPVPVRNPGITG